MSEPASSYTTLRIHFDPYSHADVQDFLKKVYRDFGRDKSRWYYRSPELDMEEHFNAWVLDFTFRDPYDATMFGLKYLR